MRPFTGDRTADKRLRVGYVSPDLREHSIRYFIEPIIAGHDRAQAQVVCYATGSRRDAQSDRLAALADEWHHATSLTGSQFADLVRSHNIDILVDLAGHTAENSLETFARRPAPVQVTYLGYPIRPVRRRSTIGSPMPSPTRRAPMRSTRKSWCDCRRHFSSSSVIQACRLIRSFPPIAADFSRSDRSTITIRSLPRCLMPGRRFLRQFPVRGC